MNFIKEFAALGKGDAAIAGGKGASLGEMTQAGIPVPPGFVLLSEAFEHFLDETGLNSEIDAVLHTVNPAEMHTVENASEKIQALILQAKMPEDIATAIQKFYKELDATYVAVRSSATAEDSASAAWAGQLDSFLNTTKDSLLINVQRCWASLFTPRAIFYRFEKELHKQKISVAVVVQKMVASEISGIAFSVHPVTEDRNQLIIEAGFGLGEAIVSGQVTPDSYVVEKEPRSIIDTNVSTQTRALYRVDTGGNEWKDIPEPRASSQVLTPEQILELSEIILTIERHYGFPCDIEWAFEGGKFYIVQSRPITTLSVTQEPERNAKAIEEIRANAWLKNWSFTWRTSFASLYQLYANAKPEDLGVGKARVDERLNFSAEGQGEYVTRFNEAYAGKDKDVLKFLVEESDALAKETGDTESSTYSRSAANIAAIIERNYRVATRGAAMLEQSKNPDNDLTNNFERIMATHATVPECFLLKVAEKTMGVAERDTLMGVIGPKGFSETEGFQTTFSKEGDEIQVRVAYKKGDYVFDRKVPESVIKEIVEEGK